MHVEDRCGDPRRDAFLHMQTPSPSPWSGRGEPRPGPSERGDPIPNTRGSLRGPGRRHSRSPPPPFRSSSIPIIPSVQCHNDNEVSCMQTGVAPAPCKEARRERATHATSSSSSSSSSSSCSSAAVGQQRQDEVALLLEEAQEQLRALASAHRKQEDGGVGGSGSAAPLEIRETVCFLNLNGGSAGALSCNGPTQTQLLSPSLSHRDLGQSSQ